MAAVKLLWILLLSGLVVLGENGGTTLAARAPPARCPIVCVQGGYITCDNYPNQQLDGCVCECAPKDGINCVLHLLGSGGTVNCPPRHA